MNNIRTLNNAFAKNPENEVKGKIVRKASLARQILRAGGNDVRIIDIKYDRSDQSRQRTVFVFEDTPEFQNVFTKILEEVKQSRNANDASEMKKEIETLRNEIAELKKKQTEE